MSEHHLLTLDEAVAQSGYRKKTLIALLHNGRLPGARRGREWLIAATDLSALPSPPARSPAAVIAAPKAQRPRVPPDLGRHELDALLTLLRDRDQQVIQLQDERARLAGQVGFLQAQLLEREGRIRLLEDHLYHAQELAATPAQLELLPAPGASGEHSLSPATASPSSEESGNADDHRLSESAPQAGSTPAEPPPAPVGGESSSQQGSGSEPADTVPSAVMTRSVQSDGQPVLLALSSQSLSLQPNGVISRRSGLLSAALRFLGMRT